MSNKHSIIYVMQKIDKIKQGCFIFCMLSLSACGMFLPSTVTTHNQTQSLEKITSSTRVSVEADIIKYKSFFDSVDDQYLIVRVATAPAGQFTTEEQYFEKINHRDYYGNAFFSQLETQKDLFLSIYLSSDHDFTEYYRPAKHLALFKPIIYICGTFFEDNKLWLAIFPNDQPDVIDNQFHHIAQISIPILIDKGLISNEQKDLCIHTAYSDPSFDFFGGVSKEWAFNDVTIESFKIKALMKELKDKGIDYTYP